MVRQHILLCWSDTDKSNDWWSLCMSLQAKIVLQKQAFNCVKHHVCIAVMTFTHVRNDTASLHKIEPEI